VSLAPPHVEAWQARRWCWAAAGLGLLALLVLPPLRQLLESRLVLHLLVQIPLLATAGALLGRALRCRAPVPGSWNAGGLPGLLLALFTAAFWMLPRSLDAALAEPAMAAAKFISLPLVLGLPLALSWSRLHPIARGFVWANLLSMSGFLGWLYLAAPARLCNFYPLDEQALLGRALLGVGGVLAACLAARAFAGGPRQAPSQRRVSSEAGITYTVYSVPAKAGPDLGGRQLPISSSVGGA
jgi:hypothetical protein